MVNSTVNGKKYPDKIIERHADKTDKLKFNYYACGKEPDPSKEMKAMQNSKKPSIPLIDSLRKNGQITKETSEYVAIKLSDGRNQNTDKKTEDITH